MKSEITYLDTTQLAGLIRERKLSSVEVVQAQRPNL
jgi:hypothetical protein